MQFLDVLPIKIISLWGYHLMLFKTDTKNIRGKTTLMIVIREKGWGITVEEHIHDYNADILLADVLAEQYLNELPSLRSLTENDVNTWVNLVDTNLANRVARPYRTSYREFLNIIKKHDGDPKEHNRDVA